MAAIGEGRHVMLIARYGGGMRGGMTNAEVTVGDGPLRALPVASSAWSAYVMEPRLLVDRSEPNLRPGAVVVVNSSLFDVGRRRGGAGSGVRGAGDVDGVRAR